MEALVDLIKERQQGEREEDNINEEEIEKQFASWIGDAE